MFILLIHTSPLILTLSVIESLNSKTKKCIKKELTRRHKDESKDIHFVYIKNYSKRGIININIYRFSNLSNETG